MQHKPPNQKEPIDTRTVPQQDKGSTLNWMVNLNVVMNLAGILDTTSLRQFGWLGLNKSHLAVLLHKY